MLIHTDHKSTFTVDEASIFLGVHRQTLYGAIRRHEIPVIRVGRRILISRLVLTELLERGNASPTAVTPLSGDDGGQQ